MPRPLNARQEQFAQLVAQGEPTTSAYATAFGGFKSPKVLAAASSRLLKNVGVRLRVQQIRDKAVELTARAQAKEEAKAETGAVLTLARKRAFLHDLVETPIGRIDETSPLCQSVKRTRSKDGGESVEYRVPDKLGALKLDAELAGELNNPGERGITLNLAVFTGETR
jgi:hypothetical protein